MPQAEIKHGGCWYCASKSQPILKHTTKSVIDADGKKDTYAVAICDNCIKAPVLDQRVPMAQRRVH